MFQCFKKSKSATKVSFEDLEKSSASLIEVLSDHGVFASIDSGLAKSENRTFAAKVTAHAAIASKDEWLGFTYRNSGVHIDIRTEIVDGVARYMKVLAWNHSCNDGRFNFAELNADIQAIMFAKSKK